MPAPSVRDHVRSLVGAAIPSVGSRRSNRIIELKGATVIVERAGSRTGSRPLGPIQAAADRVFEGEEIRLDESSVGANHGFIGAVLQSMPGVEVLQHPNRARLADLWSVVPREVELYLQRVESPIKAPNGRKFHVLGAAPGNATYRPFHRMRAPSTTVSTVALQAILIEVRKRAPGSELTFTVGVEPSFAEEHGDFAWAVIAGVGDSSVRGAFDGVVPDDRACIGHAVERAPTAAHEIRSQHQGVGERRHKQIGVPYQPADEAVSIAEHHPFATDAEVIERGTRSHAQLQNQLAAEVESAGLSPLSPSGEDPAFDLAWWDGAEFHVAEVKSTNRTNEEDKLRLGLGQLLRYRHALSEDGTMVHATLYVERQPTDDAWTDLCDSLGVKLRWPGR